MAYKDKEKKREYDRLYRQTHKEEGRERDRLYRQAHREEIREYHRLYCQTHKVEHNDWRKKWRAKHRELGLCIKCVQPALPFNTLCLKHYWNSLIECRRYNCAHSEESKKYTKERYQKWKNEGLCPHCGAPVHGGIWCPDCLEVVNHGSKRRRSFAITYV